MQYLLTAEEYEKLHGVTATRMLIEFVQAVAPLTSRSTKSSELLKTATDNLMGIAARYGANLAEVEEIWGRMQATPGVEDQL